MNVVINIKKCIIFFYYVSKVFILKLNIWRLSIRTLMDVEDKSLGPSSTVLCLPNNLSQITSWVGNVGAWPRFFRVHECHLRNEDIVNVPPKKTVSHLFRWIFFWSSNKIRNYKKNCHLFILEIFFFKLLLYEEFIIE